MSTSGTDGRRILRLRAMGFCGADDSVTPSQLSGISAQQPWVEWGVLFREELQGTPRYASWDWLQQLQEELQSSTPRQTRTAAHLCGDHVNEVLRGKPDFVAKLHEDFGFKRVQINPTAVNGVDTSDLSAGVEGLRTVFAMVPGVEFILQANEETTPLWQPLVAAPPSNMAVLFDESKGLGTLPADWPEPHEDISCGYAGGLGPANIEAQLRVIADRAGGKPVWVDSESSLRSLSGEEDRFDLGNCQEMIDAVGRLGDEYNVIFS